MWSLTRFDFGLLLVSGVLGFAGASQLLPLAHASQPPCWGVEDQRESFRQYTLSTDEDLPSWEWLGLGRERDIELVPTDPDEPSLIIEWSRMETGP